MALTEIQIRQAKVREKTLSLGDGRGLILEVRPSGTKMWIARYWEAGRERRKSLGSWPEMSLKAARDANFEFRKAAYTEVVRSPDTVLFRELAEEWWQRQGRPAVGELTAKKMRGRLDGFILPALGELTVGEVTPRRVRELCQGIEDRGTIETAHRVKQMIGRICRYGMATEVALTDPTMALAGALATVKAKHRAAITDEAGIRDLMERIRGYRFPVLRLALLFSALTFARPGEVRHGEWSEVDFDNREWRIPEEKMKMRRPHIVPLCEEAMTVLRELRGYTGHQRWLFPSPRNDGRPMSENGVRVALRSLGYSNDEMSPHGFRAMASTTLNEHGWPVDVIERQLAHVERSAVRAAYNRAEYLGPRREMMSWWGRFLWEVS